jgi:hypothetical protein
MSDTDYSKLRLDVIEKLIIQRGIECKMKKNEMVKMLIQYDEGNYVEPDLKFGLGYINKLKKKLVG